MPVPTPIALTWSDYEQTHQPFRKLHRLVDIFEKDARQTFARIIQKGTATIHVDKLQVVALTFIAEAQARARQTMKAREHFAHTIRIAIVIESKLDQREVLQYIAEAQARAGLI